MLRFFRIFGALVLAVLVILLILPYFVSLEQYREKIVAQVSKTIGREVNIGKQIDFRILPRPFVKLYDLSVASPKDVTDKDVLQVKKVEVTLSLLALLKGQIEVVQFTLGHPKLNLVALENKKNNWTFPDLEGKSAASETAVTGANGEVFQAPQPLPFKIQKIKISDGDVVFNDVKSKHELKDINLNVLLDSITGPYRIFLELKALGKTVELKGQIEQIANQIPLDLKLEGFGIHANLKGNLVRDPLNFQGDLHAEGDLKGVKSYLAEFEFKEAVSDDFKLNTKVVYEKDHLSLSNLKINFGELEANGQIDYALKTNDGQLSLDISPGNVSIKVVPQNAPNDIFKSHFSIRSKNTQGFLAALKLKTKDFPGFLLGDLDVQGDLRVSENSAQIQNLLFSLGGAGLAGNIKVQDFATPKIDYTLKTSSASKIAKLLGMTLPGNLNLLVLKGETIVGKDDRISTDSIVDTAGATLHAVGFIDLKDEKRIRPNLNLGVKGHSLASTMKVFEIDVPKSLGTFDLNFVLKGDVPQNLEVQFGASSLGVGSDKLSLGGGLSLGLIGSKPRLNANISLSKINLDRLLVAFDQQRASQGYFKLVSTNPAQQQQTHPSSRWSSDKIDLGFLKSFEGDLKVVVASIHKGDLVFDHVNFVGKVANGILDVTNLTSGLFGGQVSLKGRISSQSNQPITATASVKDAQLKNISPKEGQVKIVGGLFNASMDFKTAGQSELQYVRNLSGVLNFSAKDGVISGFDLQKVVNQLNNTKDVGSALRLLTTSFSGGNTRFSTLDVAVNFDKGIGTINKFVLEGTGAGVNVSGSVNLPQYTMDIPMMIELSAAKNFPPVKVRIYGPLDAPKRDIDSKKLLEYMSREVFSKIINSIKEGGLQPENLIKGFLGGGSNSEQSSSSQSSQESSTSSGQQENIQPKEAIKSILKGLF